jgi:hypothetical protein
MCYSFRTSIISYTIGMISAVFAFCTRQFVLGSLILCYSQMQLSEMIIWHGIDTDNIRLNKIGTSFGKYLLALHNVAIGIGIILGVYFIQKKTITLRDILPLIAGILFFIVILVVYYLPNDYPSETYQQDPKCQDKSCQTQGNRLNWPYPHHWYIFGYIISLIIVIFWIKPLRSQLFVGGLFTLTFIISVIVMPKVIGSLWCFSTAILAPILVLGNYYIIRGLPNNEILT